jgi:hypothetical protein
MLLKKILPILLTTLVITLLTGCSETNDKVTSVAAIEMVPQRADIVAQITLGDILDDAAIESLYARLPKDTSDPQTLEEGLATVINETGIDPRDLEEVLIFSDTSSGTGDQSYIGAIAAGTFTEDSFITDIEESTENSFQSFDYKGYKMYTDEGRQWALAFLNDNTFVMGDLEPVEDVIDVRVGDEPALAGDVLEKYNRLDSALVKLATNIAPEYTQGALDEAYSLLPVPIDLSAVADLEIAGLTIDREEESIALDLELCFSSAQSAEDVKGFISIVQWVIQMPEILAEIPGDIDVPEEGLAFLTELLDRIEVEVADSCLLINITMTLDEIEQLYTEFEQSR